MRSNERGRERQSSLMEKGKEKNHEREPRMGENERKRPSQAPRPREALGKEVLNNLDGGFENHIEEI